MRDRHSTFCSEVSSETSVVETVVDFSAILHVELIVVVERNELITEDFWTSIFWDFWAGICSSCEASEIVTFLTADFFSALHTDLSAWDRKDELMTDFFAWCSRLCLRRSSLNLNVCLQCRHVADLSSVSHVDSAAEIERDELNIVLKIDVENVFVKAILKSCKKMKFDWLSNQMSTKSQRITFLHSSNSVSSYRCWHCWRCWMKMMIWLNRFFSEFWWDRVELKISKDANKDNSMIDFFIVSYTRLTVSIERDALMIEDFWIEISWCFDSNVWEDDDFNEVTKHWVDLFFFDSDTFSDVWTERCVLSCEMIVLRMNADSNICFDVVIWTCNSDESNDFMTTDFFFVAHSDSAALISRREFLTCIFECCSLLCSRNDFLKLKVSSQCRHVVDFSVDSDLASNVKDERDERFNRVTILNVDADSFIDFWIANEANDLCEANDVFLISHTKLTALIER